MDRTPSIAQVNAEGPSVALYMRDLHNKFSSQNLWWGSRDLNFPALLAEADGRLLHRGYVRGEDWEQSTDGALYWDAPIRLAPTGTVTIRQGIDRKYLYPMGIPGLPTCVRLSEREFFLEACALLHAAGYRVPVLWRPYSGGWTAYAVTIDTPFPAPARRAPAVAHA